jgi:hypothetical protein
MALQLLHPEFAYIKGTFYFLFYRDLSSHEIARLNGVERASAGEKVTPCYNVVFTNIAKVARHHLDTWRMRNH